ncbi:hypothetical protein XU18_4806 [Perkinsela sp. CCAP 1560/4]|nr:hypothetical protein XU18_4806 [Perkinsela sp. CCAP 1560/4]|eukprot:KNH03852.1 hypothetical protein XU18_4806 [Perkinsela sp. CCAP 1560/4]
MAADVMSYNAKKSFEDAKAIYFNTLIFSDTDGLEWNMFRDFLCDAQRAFTPSRTKHIANDIRECIDMTIEIFRFAEFFNIFRQRFEIIRCEDVFSGGYDAEMEKRVMPSALIDWGIRNMFCRGMELGGHQLLSFSAAVYKCAQGVFLPLARTMFLGKMHRLTIIVQSHGEQIGPPLTLIDYIILLQYCRFFEVYDGRLCHAIADYAVNLVNEHLRTPPIASAEASAKNGTLPDNYEKLMFMLFCSLCALGHRAANLDSYIRPIALRHFLHETRTGHECDSKINFPTLYTDSLSRPHHISPPLSTFSVLFLKDQESELVSLQKHAHKCCLSSGFYSLETLLAQIACDVHFVQRGEFTEISNLCANDSSTIANTADKLFYTLRKSHPETLPTNATDSSTIPTLVFPFPHRSFLQQLSIYISCLTRHGSHRELERALSDISALFDRSTEMISKSTRKEIADYISRRHPKPPRGKQTNTLYFALSVRKEWLWGAELVTRILESLFRRLGCPNKRKTVTFGIKPPESTIHRFLLWMCRYSFLCVPQFSPRQLAVHLFFVLKLGYYPVSWVDRVIFMIVHSEEEKVSLIGSGVRSSEDNMWVRIRYLVFFAVLPYLPAKSRREMGITRGKMRRFRTMDHRAWRKVVQNMVSKVKAFHKK